MGRVSEWPTVGARVVVWSERPPSSTPRDPYEGAVDHVAGRTFTVAGLEATFSRSTGRSKPSRHGAGAFGIETYVAVDADSGRARQVLHTTARRDRRDQLRPPRDRPNLQRVCGLRRERDYPTIGVLILPGAPHGTDRAPPRSPRARAGLLSR
jgi:hypothetical protein